MTARAAAASDATDQTDENEAAGPLLLTRAAILAVDDVIYEYVEVPEWGGTVRIRSLSGTDRDAYDAESYVASQKASGSALESFRVRRVGRCIVDQNGLRVFSDKDFAVLGAKSGAVIDRLDDVVVRLSKIGPDEEAKAKADLKVVPSDGSGSD